MSRHYLLYWKLKTVEYHYYGEGLDHIASDLLKKTEPGDVVWIVTVRGGDLLLAGRLVVGTVSDEAEADAVFDPLDPFAARWHATAQEGTAEPMQLINLTELAVTMSLRFEGTTADRLRLNRAGRLNPMSLYHIRQLTDESAALLNYTWHSGRESVQGVEHVEIDRDTFIYAEGKPVVQTRVLRQRSSKLVNEAKARYYEVHGELRCQVCDMNFEEVYGSLGEGYIEAHHPEPVSEMDGEQFVDVDGIVLLCANCHRMVHRKSPPFSIEELRRAVEQNRKQE